MSALHIRFGGYQKPASIHNQAAVRFGELLKQKLGDRITFELIGNVLDLGRGSGDLPIMVGNGELDFCYISTVRFTDAVPELQLLELPFVVPSRDAVCRALDGELGARFTRRMHESTPYRALGYWDNGFRHFSNKVRPIRTPADCKGIRIRTQMSALHGEAFKTLGFEPIPADIKDFAAQVSGDRFQAQDNPLTNTYNFNVHKYHRYHTLTGHFFGASAFICNAKTYAGWPADIRAAVDEAAQEATRFQRQLAAAEDEAMLKKLKAEDVELITPSTTEHAAFVAALAPMLEKYKRALDPALFAFLA